MAEWIAANAQNLNLEMVLHLGDLVNLGNDTEFQVADAALGKIRDANIPLLTCIGNHDFDGGNPSGRENTKKYNQYFGVHTFQNKPWFGGLYEPGKAENVYFKKTISGERFLFLALEFGPRDEVLDWAEDVLENHSDHHVFIVTHSYMHIHGNRTKPGDSANPKSYFSSNANDGEDMWQKFVRRHKNIRAVYNGHHGPLFVSHRFDHGDHGNLIFQSFQNWQEATEGGQGRLRIMEIDLSSNNVEFKTFNPVTRQYETLPGYSFNFTFEEGGTMANRYANLTPSKKISEDFQNITIGFDKVQQDVDGLEQGLTQEIADREAAVQAVDQRVDNIIVGGGPDKDPELVDIRTPAPEYTPLEPISTAGGMTRDMQKQFVGHEERSVLDSGGVHGLEIESGSFTPFLGATDADGSHSYATRVGRYYRIGKIVYFFTALRLSSKDGSMSGEVRIKGLPFQSANIEFGLQAVAMGDFRNISGISDRQLAAQVLDNSKEIQLFKPGNEIDRSPLVASDISGFTVISVAGTYFID